ncbi:MAG TPA: hypothetical protein VNO21_01365 [Polyangiaceae bacterium]|nr:hypothetical protein [Polyangiaceae bacterium]
MALRRRVVLVGISTSIAGGIWAIGCNAILDNGEAQLVTSVPDAGPPDTGPPCDWAKPFNGIEHVANVNTSGNDEGLWLLPGELTAFLSSDRDGGLGSYDLYYATRGSTTDLFNTPIPVAGSVNTTRSERRPASPDGSTLYFTLDVRSIVFATRNDSTAEFDAPAAVGGVNDAGSNTAPFLTPDGKTLYFSSTRAGDSGTDIYRATSNGSNSFGAVTLLGSDLNTTADDGSFIMTPDGLTIFFSSKRAGGKGLDDIWTAHRSIVGSTFTDRRNVAELNTVRYDSPSWVSPDGCRLYFTSDGHLDDAGLGGYDIYYATR